MGGIPTDLASSTSTYVFFFTSANCLIFSIELYCSTEIEVQIGVVLEVEEHDCS